MYLLFLYAVIFCSFIQSAHDQEIEVGGGRVVLWSNLSQPLARRYGASLDQELGPYLEYRRQQSWNACTDTEQLQHHALIAMAIQQKKDFQHITNRLAKLNPACINDRYPSGFTLLLSTINGGHLVPVSRDMVQHLIQVFGDHLDPNLGMEDTNTSPLFFAAQEGDDRTCSLLLQHKKITIDNPRKDGATPFAIAAEWGHKNVLELFEKHRKTRKINANNNADFGITPLLASITPKKDAQSGSFVSIPEMVSMYLVSTWGADVNLGNCAGIMPLFLAVVNKKFDLAHFLIDRKVKRDVFLPQHNHNVLHYIGISTDGIRSNPGDISVQDIPKLKLLIQKIIGKDNKHLFNELTSYGDAPSHLVVNSENAPNLIKAFFEGAKSVGVNAANIPDSEGRTALQRVVWGGDVAVVKYLLNQSANPWIQDKEGNNALDVARMSEDNDAIIALLQDQMKKIKPPVIEKKKKQKSANLVDKKPVVQEKSSSSSSSSSSSCSSNQVAKKSLIKIDPSRLLDFSALKSPDGVIALRQKTGTSKILIGYTVEGSSGKYEAIDASRYAPSACKTGDLYHAFDEAIDPYIIQDGHTIAADQQEAFQDLLTKYSITMREGNTAYVLPGRIESSWYDIRYALKDKDKADPFRGHSGAFVLIENKNGAIMHRQFHPSQEQKSIRSTLQ